MHQQIILIGNLGNKPEMRYTPSGVAVATFSLAVNRKWTDGEGQTQEKTTWFRITTWRKQAETCSEYLTKGSKVMVIGEIEEARPWTDKDGVQRASLEVTAQTVKFLSGRGDAPHGADADGEQAGPAKRQAKPERQAVRDEDIPF